MKPEKESFAPKLEEIQKRRNISQSALARGAQTYTTAIGRIIRLKTQPKLSTVLALAIGLRLTIWDQDAVELLEAAGYDRSSLSPYQRSMLENWPENEGIRVSVDTSRMLTSIQILISSDLLSAAPNPEIRKTLEEIHLLLDRVASADTRLNRQIEAYLGGEPSHKGYRTHRKPKEE